MKLIIQLKANGHCHLRAFISSPLFALLQSYLCHDHDIVLNSYLDCCTIISIYCSFLPFSVSHDFWHLLEFHRFKYKYLYFRQYRVYWYCQSGSEECEFLADLWSLVTLHFYHQFEKSTMLGVFMMIHHGL